MNNLNLIIAMQEEWQRLAKEYQAILEHNKKYQKAIKIEQTLHPKDDKEKWFAYDNRIENNIIENHGLLRMDDYGYKAKLKRLRVLITQLMLDWQKE